MNAQSRAHIPPPPLAQRGIALPVVLLFLLIITVAASFGIRRATLSEGITRNQLDYEVARQAAEAALRDAERDLLQVSSPGGTACSRGAERPVADALAYFTKDCPRGQCQFDMTYYSSSNYDTVTNPQPWWPSTKGGKWNDSGVDTSKSCTFNGAVPIGTFTGTPNVNGVARQPEYLTEFMIRGTTKFFRITARGFGADINTEVVLQSYFRPSLY